MVTKDKKKELPRNVDALLELLGERDDIITALKHKLEVFARMLYGPTSEKRKLTGAASGHRHQLHLFLADVVADAERVAERTGAVGHVEVKQPNPPKSKKKGRRKKFPDHLPVVETVFQLPESERVCSCGNPLHAIGFEESRELERIEITIVHKTKREKYGCRACEEGVKTAPGPARVIDKGMLSAGFLAHVIGERIQFHMPYYRLEKKYGSEGLDISRSVLERSVARCAELLAPLHAALQVAVIGSDIVFTDDTPVTIATQSGKSGSRKGRVWIYLNKRGQHFYDFTETRERDGPLAIFKDFEGFVQADAYPGYDELFRSEKITEVMCWAHVRRKFETAASSDPELSAEALDMIAKLYRVEKKARDDDLDPGDVAALREEYSCPVLDQIRAWLEVAEAKALPKSPIGRAVAYARSQWNALVTYVSDGRLEIDNNAAERAMRPIAVGRKNWLFFQTKGGGKTAAVMMSLIQTAEAAGVNVKMYLRDVLQRISTETDVKKLLPHAWKEHFQAEVEGRRNEIIDLLIADQRGQ